MGRKQKEKYASQKFYMYYTYWMNRMLYVAASSVHWKGLPESCDPIILENCLNWSGSACMIKDPIVDDYFVGQNASTGPIDIYGYPKDRAIIFMNGQRMIANREDSVIIYNNSRRSSDLWFFEYMATRLADMDSAIDINMQSQKTMPMIPVSQEQALTVENIYSGITNNLPYVLLDGDSINIESLRSALLFDNRKSFTSDLMIQVQREIWNRFLTFVGINNVNVEKRERTNIPEINSNLDEILAMRRNRLNARERAAVLMKKQWGIEVEPVYYGDEVMTNGSIYDTGENNLRTTVSDQKQFNEPVNFNRNTNNHNNSRSQSIGLS